MAAKRERKVTRLKPGERFQLIPDASKPDEILEITTDRRARFRAKFPEGWKFVEPSADSACVGAPPEDIRTGDA